MSKSKNLYYTELRKEYPRTWRIWYRMNKRVDYGVKGYTDIIVCDEWNIDTSAEQGFLNFFDDMGESEGKLEIDRINPFGDYEPNNCRWVTRTTQNNNTRKHCQGDYEMLHLAYSNNIPRHTFYGRIKRGWAPIDAATLPSSKIPYRNRLI
jgi:hypothetical protein